jgi:hypothetical protein
MKPFRLESEVLKVTESEVLFLDAKLPASQVSLVQGFVGASHEALVEAPPLYIGKQGASTRHRQSGCSRD